MSIYCIYIQYHKQRPGHPHDPTAFVLPDTTYPDDDYSRYRLIDLYKEVHSLMTQRHALESPHHPLGGRG